MIVVENDGKGKYNSFEATVELDSFSHGSAFFGGISITAWGETEEEARADLMKILEMVKTKL